MLFCWCYFDEGANITSPFSSIFPSREVTNRLSWPKSTFRRNSFQASFLTAAAVAVLTFLYCLTHAMCYYCYYSVTWLRDGPHLWTNSWSTSSTLLAGWPLNMSEANTEKHSSSGPDPVLYFTDASARTNRQMVIFWRRTLGNDSISCFISRYIRQK